VKKFNRRYGNANPMWTAIPIPDLPNPPKLDELFGAPSGRIGSGPQDLFAPDQRAQVQGHPHLAAGILLKNLTKHSIYGDDLDAPSLDIPAPPVAAIDAIDAFLEKDTPIVPPKPDFRAAAQAAFARKSALLESDLQRLKRILGIVHDRTVRIATEAVQVDGRTIDIQDIPPPQLPSSVSDEVRAVTDWLAEIGKRIETHIDGQK
jgi:hypothetical protein